jgi:hypothetical protein
MGRCEQSSIEARGPARLFPAPMVGGRACGPRCYRGAWRQWAPCSIGSQCAKKGPSCLEHRLGREGGTHEHHDAVSGLAVECHDTPEAPRAAVVPEHGAPVAGRLVPSKADAGAVPSCWGAGAEGSPHRLLQRQGRARGRREGVPVRSEIREQVGSGRPQGPGPTSPRSMASARSSPVNVLVMEPISKRVRAVGRRPVESTAPNAWTAVVSPRSSPITAPPG